MTNAEKYKEVFGFEPDMKSCPTYLCFDCPLCEEIGCKRVCGSNTRMWWMDDYKGVNNG